MNLAHASIQPYALPLARAWTTADGITRTRHGFLLHLTDDDGHRGVGDAAPLPGHDHELPRVQRALARVARHVTRHPGRVPPITPRPPAARHAWTQALLDLRGQHEGKPLHALLSPRRAARTVQVNAALPIRPTRATVRDARRLYDEGYTCLKLKVRPTDADLKRVASVRDALPRVQIRLDANAAWSLRLARRLLDRYAPLGIDYVEQPLPTRRLAELARLRAHSPVRIAADESAHTPRGVHDVLDNAAADVVILKPMALGGLDHAHEAATAARDQGVRVVVTDSLESDIGRAGALHLAALTGREPAGLATGRYLLRQLTARPLRPRRGRLHVPVRPGLGIQRPEAPR